MNHKHSFSDEAINAFIDNQLLAEEKERFYTGLEQDKDLSHYVCRLRTMHELIQDAYNPETLPPLASQRKTRNSWNRLCRAAAVLLLFVAGGTAGWFGRGQMYQDIDVAALATQATAASHARERSVLLHISSGDPERINMALGEAERMLQRAHEDGTPLQLEILANDGGLNLLRAGNVDVAAKIAALKQDYGNVSFMACAKALQRLQEKGVHYKLVPQAQVVPSALDEIVERMEKGWIYIRV